MLGKIGLCRAPPRNLSYTINVCTRPSDNLDYIPEFRRYHPGANRNDCFCAWMFQSLQGVTGDGVLFILLMSSSPPTTRVSIKSKVGLK